MLVTNAYESHCSCSLTFLQLPYCIWIVFKKIGNSSFVEKQIMMPGKSNYLKLYSSTVLQR